MVEPDPGIRSAEHFPGIVGVVGQRHPPAHRHVDLRAPEGTFDVWSAGFVLAALKLELVDAFDAERPRVRTLLVVPHDRRRDLWPMVIAPLFEHRTNRA